MASKGKQPAKASRPKTVRVIQDGPKQGKGSASKQADIQRLLAQMQAANSNQRLVKFATALVNPADAEPLVFPSPVPARVGTAHFPLVLEVSGMADFGVIVRPTLIDPLIVTHDGDLAETNDVFSGKCFFPDNDSFGGVTILTPGGANQDCEVGTLIVDGKRLTPISSAVGGTFNVRCDIVWTQKRGIFKTWYYNAGVWVLLDTTPAFGLGLADRVTGDLTMPAQAGAVSGLSFEWQDENGTENITASATFQINITVGTWTCNIAGANTEVVMDTYEPEWDNLMSASKEMRVVSQSCMVTYMGSTLANQGSIAVCNADSDLAIVGSFYSTAASRPFDRYEGRVGGEGSTPGGAHWHYIPDDPRDLIVGSSEADPHNTMCGYFGVKGMDPTQPVRIRMDMVINFFSTDPSYHMEFQPEYNGFSRLIHDLRVEVPLVSSNDDHLKKVLRAAQSVAKKGATFLSENPELMLKAITLLLTLA